MASAGEIVANCEPPEVPSGDFVEVRQIAGDGGQRLSTSSPSFGGQNQTFPHLERPISRRVVVSHWDT